MDNSKTPVILGEEDFRMLKQFAEQFPSGNMHQMSLSYELNRAIVIEDDKVPPCCVRLNSLVKVREMMSNTEMEFSIVMPALANIAERKISVLTPMGAALIGLCKGEKVEWKMPGGIKHFEILEVRQEGV
ncbi:GreA/GreB family elongation factor [Dyadobacter bucti]|uniref:GreA/GreB family elongation factor n=1 Tax=Dyadobacter bucti TaxID=2572203 RepID=UPI001107BCD6|nr:GreA/GreB family elongation factor [Dyadobacter bucti]